MPLPRPVTHGIFDMDGVLLDTERFYTEVTQKIVSRFGKRFDWSHKINMIGRSPIESARYLVDALELPITAEQYLEERQGALDQVMSRAEPMPGAQEITAALHDAGLPLAVATSSTRHLFEIKTSRHRDWFDRFQAVVVGDDPRLRASKPAPDIFLLAAADLEATPETCLVVEDSPAGLAAAHAACMQVVAVPYPGMDPSRLADAELLLESLTQLDLSQLLGG
jgi:pseudouridine-5'-monophosphatase